MLTNFYSENPEGERKKMSGPAERLLGSQKNSDPCS
jgi:hypothetical protein